MKNPPQRYLAIDVMRGMTLALMIIVNSPGNEATTYAPFLHAPWHGFTLTDLVFPTFMFVVGSALSFTLQKFEGMDNAAVLKKIFVRTFLIFMCGYLMFWLPYIRITDAGLSIPPFSGTRIPGVLQRIALGYGFASLIVHYWKVRGAVIFSVVALLGYWLLMYAFGDYTLTGNAVLKLDLLALGPNHLYHEEGIPFDPEGILSTLPSIVNVLAGYFAGRFVQQKGHSFETVAKLMMAGATCIVIALCWDSVFPINKKLWTSSYVFCTVGLDLVVLALLVYVIEIAAIRRWTYFFEVFGKNTLFIYLFAALFVMTVLARIHIGTQHLYAWTYTHVFRPLAGDYAGSLLFSVAYMLLCWCVAYAMDKKKIYVKL